MMRSRYVSTLAAILIGSALLCDAAGQKFYRDDPIWNDPETQDASGATETPPIGKYEFVQNTFNNPGERTDKRAVNVNTVDEVPNSSWFTNRLGRQPWSIDQLVRGPDTGTGPARGPWTIIEGKSEGVTPGFTIRDSAGDTYFIKFDPPSNPEMASGAEVIATKLFYAFGYYTPENYIATVPDALSIAPGTEFTDEEGRERPMETGDIRAILKKTARHPDGSYRVLASKLLPGKTVGRFRYWGTRSDDPNDIHPHEHRRELRGLSVFAAWLNHDEVRSDNTFDVLVKEGDRTIIRHYLLDFGSALGSGSTQAQSTRAGNEYLWEARPTFVTMLTLGLYVRPWLKVDYPDLPAVGRFESTYFQPENWKPDSPNPAFRNARPDDQFWAARILAALSPEAVEAVVRTAQFSDPRATEYVSRTLLERRSKILWLWLNATNPVVDVALSGAGALTFQNAAVQAGTANPADRYTLSWSRFDNAAGTHTPVGPEQTTTITSAQAPELLASGAEHIAVTIRAVDHRPAWRQPLTAYFRRDGDRWALVGLERNP
jgi:hypothetical protein